MIKLGPTERFSKALAGQTAEKGKRIKKALELFRKNQFHPSLNFEKVKGTNYATIRANRGDRICLRKVDTQTYDLVDVGPHDYIYRNYG